MKKLLHKKLSILKKTNFRTKNIINHIFSSFFFKVGALLSNFALIPLIINYLGTENYGIWLTISSFVTWFSFFDLGLGNGLRNKLTEALAENNFLKARSYVSIAYISVASISVVFLFLFFTLNFFIDWSILFSIKKNLNNVMLIIASSFCVQLVFKLIAIIYLANQNHSIQVKIHFVEQVLLLISVWIMTNYISASLLKFVFVFSFIPILILIFLNAIGFAGKYKFLTPSFKHWDFSHLKNIMSLGVNFFLIQLSGIILFSTDNFIITKLFSPEEVVPYNIAFKYYSIITMVFTLIVNPYWSSFTEAFKKNDLKWIKKSINNLLKFWLILPFLLIIMIFFSELFFKFWVGNQVFVEFSLSISMAIYTLIFSLNMIFVFFLNGIGKIKIQLLISVLSLFINIPLSVFLAKNCNLGTSGVILATTVSILISAIVSPIQYYKIINLKSKGIWNR